MTEFLLVIIIGLLIYFIYLFKHQNTGEQELENKLSFHKVLPDYINKTCEINVKEPLSMIDIMFSVKGILIDMDDEWIMLEISEKRKKTIKMVRIENISSIKEIVA